MSDERGEREEKAAEPAGNGQAEGERESDFAAGVDTERPSPSRVYDFWLGGHHNFAIDREVGRRALEAMPTLRGAIWANRAFLRRVVRYLVTECGIRQFLDLGSGVPTEGNVHEIAQRAEPSCRVVYVDIDQVAVSHSQQILRDNDRADVIRADLRDPDAVLDDPRVRAILDLGQPVAVLMNAVLHFLPDSERPGDVVCGYIRRLASGSFLSLSHAAPDLDLPDEQTAMVKDYERSTGVQFIHRTPDELQTWLDGMELEPPGIVLVNEWHPDSTAESILRTYGLLARKP